MQNKRYFFFGNRGSQKGGRGGGSDLWKKFPKIPFFFGVASLIIIIWFSVMEHDGTINHLLTDKVTAWEARTFKRIWRQFLEWWRFWVQCRLGRSSDNKQLSWRWWWWSASSPSWFWVRCGFGWWGDKEERLIWPFPNYTHLLSSPRVEKNITDDVLHEKCKTFFKSRFSCYWMLLRIFWSTIIAKQITRNIPIQLPHSVMLREIGPQHMKAVCEIF